ncbi:endonuclease/exonuclease/phosphatase family protein [uncultured Aquabacterium sp.]|uniref:endonuclease/exonuclease/phosphatase family protein n=1 Tax=uncultured Aquabacterium sp. TaxID=158753 RepID=UPI0030D32318
MRQPRSATSALAATFALSATLALASTGQAQAGWLSGIGLGSAASTGADGLTLATWNVEWLMTPQTRTALGATCTAQQPRSDQRALPCTPGRTPPPERTAADVDALARTAQALRHAHGVDVIALQEVDGAEAARQVFRQGWRLDCFVQRQHPQKVGFAIRDGIPYRCNGDLQALDVDGGTRSGADVTLWPGTRQEVRLLSVHLKSGCFTGKLDRNFPPCARLRQQVPVVEAWVDQRVREGVAFALLGDFNRHLDKDARYPAGPDEAAPFNLMQAWSDHNPPGAELLRATEGERYIGCDAEDRHKQYIDDILIDRKLADRHKNRRFARLPFDAADAGRTLSDHCPVIWSLKP